MKLDKGFTLVELIVVIAVLGVLAVVLISTIDPVDRIKSANDAGVLSTTAQLGRANDSYAASHTNLYPIATAFAGVVTALNTEGEIKFSSITAPATYTYNYIAPSGCVAGAQTSCTSYVYYVDLKSKKYATTPFYVYANGKGCTYATAPTASTFTCP